LTAHGPLAIKFAQWASTRPDILPASICHHFAELQDAVRPHPFRSTAAAILEAFGPKWEGTLRLEEGTIGSGCMAQVYKGRLLRGDPDAPDAWVDVAVKVRHPGAQQQVDLDLALMWRAVLLLEALAPTARYLAMSEALAHFEAFVRPQADLRIEAGNLDEFQRNFTYRSTGRGLPVRFPKVVRPYVTDAVLVETFEPAVPLRTLMREPPKGQAQPRRADGVPEGMTISEAREHIGGLCMDMFLQMLFADNFIHADLHPGNIHFRFGRSRSPELVVFDAGLAVRLSREDRRNFLEVFHAIATNDGRRAGNLMLERTPGDRSHVRDEEAFVSGVAGLITSVRSGGIALGKVRLGDVFTKMLGLACDHCVKLETSFVTVATSIIVIEGVGRQLRPLTDIVMAAQPLLVEALTQKLW